MDHTIIRGSFISPVAQVGKHWDRVTDGSVMVWEYYDLLLDYFYLNFNV